MVGTSSGLPGRCSQATEHSRGKWDISLVQLTQVRPLGPKSAYEFGFWQRFPEFMLIYGWDPGKATAGWEWR